jgi:hypothetical protein
MHQLNKIFARETVDLIHVSDIQAADYFKPMDDLVFLKLFGKSKRTPKEGKAFDELTILEETVKAVLTNESQIANETVVAGETISKEKLTSELKPCLEKPDRFKINSKKRMLLIG